MMIEAFVIGSIKVNVRRLGSDFVPSYASNSKSGVSSLLKRASIFVGKRGWLQSAVRDSYSSSISVVC